MRHFHTEKRALQTFDQLIRARNDGPRDMLRARAVESLLAGERYQIEHQIVDNILADQRRRHMEDLGCAKQSAQRELLELGTIPVGERAVLANPQEAQTSAVLSAREHRRRVNDAVLSAVPSPTKMRPQTQGMRTKQYNETVG